jgi:site-specific DNA recombinase
VSTAEQANEGHSIGEQQERLKKYCEAHDWKIYNIYVDPGFSGGNTDRPALKQLLLDVRAGRIQKVVVYKLDRLSRSQKDTLQLIEDEFLANNVDFVSMQENFDTSTPFGRAMIGILAVFAQLEREQIKERMEMGKDARAKQGKWMSGVVQYGYKKVDDQLVIDDFEAMIVRRMFRSILEGKTTHAIAKELNEEGFRTRKTIWKDRTIVRMMRSKTYIGFGKYKDQWIKGTHDPIIDVDTYEEVNKILDQRRDYRLKNVFATPGKANSYLGGLLICAHCGAHYTKNSTACGKLRPDGTKYKYNLYCCTSRYPRGKAYNIKDPNCKNKTWRMEELDALVFDQIRSLAVDPDFQKHNEPVPDNSAELVQAEIDKLNDQILRLMDLYQIGSIPFDAIQAKIADADQQRKQLENKLVEINKENESRMTREQGAEIAASFDDVLEGGDFLSIRKVITSLIGYIEIDGEDISIHWNF